MYWIMVTRLVPARQQQWAGGLGPRGPGSRGACPAASMLQGLALPVAELWFGWHRSPWLWPEAHGGNRSRFKSEIGVKHLGGGARVPGRGRSRVYLSLSSF